MKKGFTIVELLAVVAVLGILMGIVGFAVGGLIKNSRVNKADAIRSNMESAINNYRAQHNQWPDAIESLADSSEESIITLSASAADAMFQELVTETLENNKSYVPSCEMLFVGPAGAEGCTDNHTDSSAAGYCGNKNCPRGIDFNIAYRGDDHIQARSISSMSFGYPGYEEGRFRRFTITYNRDADKVTVSK